MKNISLYPKENQWHILAIPVPLRGALAIVTTRGGSRWTPKLRLTSAAERTVKSCGPDVAVLASMHLGGSCLSGRDGGKRAVLRGEHAISRKAIAQGRPDVLRCPVCSCVFFVQLHARPRVQRAPGFPAPSSLEGGNPQTSGMSCREMRTHTLPARRRAAPARPATGRFNSWSPVTARPASISRSQILLW